MEKSAKKKVTTQDLMDRRIVSYLPIKYRRLFNLYALFTNKSRSKCAIEMFQKFFDEMPEDEMKKLRKFEQILAEGDKTGGIKCTCWSCGAVIPHE